MIYTLEKHKKFSSRLLPWTYVFWSLSTTRFSQVYKTLGFLLDPSEDLKKIAHDFALTWDIVTNIQEFVIMRENVLKDPIVGAILDNSLREMLLSKHSKIFEEQLFQHTFTRLEHINYAGEVYHWGKQTHTFVERYDVQALHALCYLFLRWLEQQEVPKDNSNYTHPAELTNTIDKYPKPNLNLDSLPLPLEVSNKLLNIIIEHRGERANFKAVIENAHTSPDSIWETFALKRGSADPWIYLEGDLRMNLKMWHIITNTLTPKQIEIIKQWALNQKIGLNKPTILNYLTTTGLRFKTLNISDRTL